MSFSLLQRNQGEYELREPLKFTADDQDSSSTGMLNKQVVEGKHQVLTIFLSDLIRERKELGKLL